MIIKILGGVLGLKYKKNISTFFLILECGIIFIYLYLLFFYNIKFSFYLFLWCLFWILIYLSNLFLNNILKKMEKIIEWIETKRWIKEKLLKPGVNKFIYYLVWLLPWNIGYWIYFWVMENGWYIRVWINSNRDIVFWKYLGWDSRDFFYNLNIILTENILMRSIWFLKDLIFKALLRLLIIIVLFKKNMLKINFFYYILNRIFIFCYLSLFYLYLFEDIYIINKWLIVILLMIEIILLIFLTNIFDFWFSFDNKIIDKYFSYTDPKILQILLDPLTGKYFVPTKAFFEVNNTVWNVILGGSLNLQILKKYMIWVNKNTNGYYYKEMNILPKYNIKKLIDIDSIPFDILPRTRYIIMQLRYVNYNAFRTSLNDYTIRSYMKKVYLSYFEKTYAIDSSLLSIIFLLRANLPMSYLNLQILYEELENDPCKKVISYIMTIQKASLWKIRLAQINKANPKFLNSKYLINSFIINGQFLDIEALYMLEFFFNWSERIPNIGTNGSIKEYKENIKLLTHFVLYEEEGIVWNPNIVEYLQKVEKNITIEKKKRLLEVYKGLINLNLRVQLTQEYEDMELAIKGFYKFVFDKQPDYNKLLEIDISTIKELDLKIVEINFNNNEATLQEHFQAIIQDLEYLLVEDVKDSRYYFLFEEDQ